MKILILFLLAVAQLVAAPLAAATQSAYHNFKAAIYITVESTRQLTDPQELEQQYARVAGQLRFDKVYLEVYRNGTFADERSLSAIKKFFTDRGIAVSGGVTLAAGGQGGQFGTFDYEIPADRAECQRAVQLAARNFDEVILDDFFFYTSKSDADIAAKGQRSWSEYRLAKMRSVAEELVLKPARASNPRVRMIIKYPNWYEHFQALGYDLDVEAHEFDAIYTGTETRDPEITDQLLQQYESYLVFRYYDNIRPHGANRGGWVDTYNVRYVDRYAEQLWDTLFAKAPEITLFNWTAMASPNAVSPGDRDAWSAQPTSFNWEDMVRAFKRSKDSGRTAHAQATASAASAPGWARAAGYSLEQADAFLSKLGRPIGIASYKPYQSSGEDFLHNYLGNIGIPIELRPDFPTEANLLLLTEAAKYDPDIVAKIKAQLVAGGNVVVTSGLLGALQDKGIQDITEAQLTGRKVLMHEFFNGYGAGSGTRLDDPGHPGPNILFPEIRFYTNDAWPLVRGVANARGFPILLMNRYSRGVFYVLNIPDNIGDLYSLPQSVTTVIKQYLQSEFPVRLEAPARVSLFAYDNRTFVVQSFLDEGVDVRVAVAAGAWAQEAGESHGGARGLNHGNSLGSDHADAQAPDQRGARGSHQREMSSGPARHDARGSDQGVAQARGVGKLVNLVTGEVVEAEADATAASTSGARRGRNTPPASTAASSSGSHPGAAPEVSFSVHVPPHSYVVFAVQ